MNEISFNDFLVWIAEHSDDTVAMDKINRLTYQFTFKFKERERDPNGGEK